jgi:hypothetical protein
MADPRVSVHLLNFESKRVVAVAHIVQILWILEESFASED